MSDHANAVAAGVVTDYLRCLDAGDFEEALKYFATDVEWTRPSVYEGESGVQRMRGHDELLAFFKRRGKQPVHHEIASAALSEEEVFAEGRLVGPEGRTVHAFLCHAELDDDGLIARYIAGVI